MKSFLRNAKEAMDSLLLQNLHKTNVLVQSEIQFVQLTVLLLQEDLE
jgi:hypothetical protein